tara:strand:+ start:906 stop:1514 length:609 start_codon:yes stop_codon:yes gene_type:complete
MKNKFLALLLSVCTIPAFADVSGSLGYTSDYVWRGISQSGGSGAMQVDLMLEKNGLYGGVWASQVDFGDEATYEMDFYGGYELWLSDKWSIDVGVLQYNWDKGYDDVEEGFVKVGLKDLSVGYYVDLSNSDNTYMEVGYTLPFIKWVDLGINYGRFDEDNDFWKVSMGKILGNKWYVNAEIYEDARQGQFTDHANIGLYYIF